MKLLKAYLKMRKASRLYRALYNLKCDDFYKSELKLAKMYDRFNSCIKHNVMLAKEIDNLYKRLESKDSDT